jgi:flagellin-like hook-associated protein FlgL
MSLRINTNIQSQNALRNVSLTSDMMGRTIERLASGLRVNRAADDPAGLIISENLRAQITGLQQAVNNAQDAVNMIKTAEAALDEVHNALRTMRQLTLHAANTGVNDYASLQADQTQIRALIDSINRIAEQTSFGTKRLLDGTSGISAAVTRPHAHFGHLHRRAVQQLPYCQRRSHPASDDCRHTRCRCSRQLAPIPRGYHLSKSDGNTCRQCRHQRLHHHGRSH